MKYRSVHNYIVRHYGKADRCEECKCPPNGKKRQYAWSNKDGKYTKARKSWWRLCYSCHKKFDYKRGGFSPWNKGNRKERPTLICEWCGHPFTQKRSEQMFCSRRCTAFRNGNIAKRKRGIITELNAHLLTRE